VQKPPGGRLVFDATRGLTTFVTFDGAVWVQTTAPAAQTVDYGSACGAATRLAGRAAPRPGSLDFGVDLAGVPGNAPVAFLWALRPARLAVGGCEVLVDPTAILWDCPARANASGFATLGVRVPRDASLAGATVFVQAIALDAAGPLLGLSLSAGLQVDVGW
jgi:hypothetical protein